jgi:hypothetical protein
MPTAPLITSATTTFDTDNSASAVLGPERAGHKWHITRMVTTSGASGDFVQTTVYRNFESPTNTLDFTFQGAQATSETDLLLYEGEKLIFEWTGGTPGSQAIMIINGEIEY